MIQSYTIVGYHWCIAGVDELDFSRVFDTSTMGGDLLTILPSLDVQKMMLFLCCKIVEKTQIHTGSDSKYPMSSMEEIED